jgi:hypothetical protein
MNHAKPVLSQILDRHDRQAFIVFDQQKLLDLVITTYWTLLLVRSKNDA